MRISREKSDIGKFSYSGVNQSLGVKSSSESSFDREMTKYSESECQSRMKELLNEIDRVNERIKRSQTINDLMLYKKLVKNFLKEALNRAYMVKQVRGRNRRGRTMMMTIDTIDKEVEELLDDFTKKKTEAGEILLILDKIRGMLIDLLV